MFLTGFSHAQNTEAKINFGDEREYKPIKDNGRYTFKAYDKTFYVFSEFISFQDKYSIIVCDEKNNVKSTNDLKYTLGVRGDETKIEKIVGLNNKAYLLISNTNKKEGKHRLFAKALDDDLTFEDGETELASFGFTKGMNSGNWIISVSPDQKHLLIIGELPFESKEIPSKIVYNYLNESLKSEKEGTLTLPGENKKYNNYTAYLANNADMFMVSGLLDKNGDKKPEIFSTNALTANEPVSYLPDLGEGKNMFSYAQTVLADNSFSMAGYYDERKKVSMGEAQIKGCFYYNSESCKDIQVSPISTPTENLIARSLTEVENTVYLLGENYKEKKVDVPGQLGFYNYYYTHKDINSVGFEANGTKKIDVILSRNYSEVSSETELMPVAAVIKSKYAVFFVDNLAKYDPARNGSTYRVPVLVYINNNGLMESPLHFSKEFSSTKDGFSLFSFIPSLATNKLQMIMMQKQDVKCFSVE